MNSVIYIAEFEFMRLKKQPLVLIITIILCFTLSIEVIGNILLSHNMTMNVTIDDFLENSLRNSFWYMTFFFSFLALCLGIVTIAEERDNNIIKVLLTKPLYRRDVIIGKFAGISIFLFFLMAMIMIVLTLSVIISIYFLNYSGSLDMSDFLSRIISYDILLYFYCIVTLSIMMLVGILFKELSHALIFAFAYLYIAWFYGMDWLGQYITINPYYLYAYTINANGVMLFDMTTSVNTWLNSAMPNIVLLLLEAIGISLFVCLLFTREEV